MNAQIITIGEELLIGQTIDTNSAWIAEELNLLGIKVTKITSISDKKEQIIETLDINIKESNLVIITGGLGPTNDDITKQTLAKYFDSELVLNSDVLDDVKRVIGARGANMLELNINQAMVPDKCKVLRNPKGTAAGMWFEKNNCVIISLPGVPFEMKAILSQVGFPQIRLKFETPFILHKSVHTTGIPESQLADILKDWEANLSKRINLAYLPSPGDIKLRLDISGENEAELHEILNTEIEKLNHLIPEAIFGYDNDTIESVVGKELLLNGLTISTAESCTGGRMATMLTSISGSSRYFKGSVVAYSNEVKHELLDVNATDLEQFGAVSEQVARQMAEGVMRKLKTDIGIATTGIAGPTGGSEDKPVGTIWIAVASKKQTFAIKKVFGNSRLRNIQNSSAFALNFLRKLLTQNQL